MKVDLLLIATSTGGTVALSQILSRMSNKVGVPILVVQHILQGYSKILARSLNEVSLLNVKEAEENDILKPSNVYIAPGGFHMKLNSSNVMPKIKIADGPKVNYLKPAADVLFSDIAQNYRGKNILVFVGTGMGKDGLDGVKLLKQNCNCYCVTQSKESCVVYGMPKAIFESGYSDEVIRLDCVADRLNKLCIEGWN